MPKLDNQMILLAFVILMAVAVLLQAIILMAILAAVRKGARALQDEAQELRAALLPVLYDARETMATTRESLVTAREALAQMQDFFTSAQGVLNRIAPKVEGAASDLAAITDGLRVQAARMQNSGVEILEKLRHQSDRVDGMVTSLLDGVDRAGGFVANFVTRPVKQVSGILATVKAVVDSLRGFGAPRQ